MLLVLTNDVPTVLNLRMNLIAALQGAGYRVTVAAPRHSRSTELTDRRIGFVPVDVQATARRPWNDAALLWRYWRLLRQVRPTAVLAYTIKPNIFGSLAARLCCVPVINNITGLGTAFISKGLLERVATTLYRPALRRSATVFFHNEDDRRLFVERSMVAADRAVVIPGSGVDLTAFVPQPLPGSADSPRFLLIGRLIDEKGIREFIEAAELVKVKLPYASFGLLGDPGSGPRAIGREEMGAWVASGLVDHSGSVRDVRPFIANADCVVLPSYREGLPRSLLEGAAMARPLIGADAPGCRDLVQDGVTGYLCNVGSGPSLAGAMLKIAALPPSEREAMGRRAREMAEERFSDRRVDEAYLAALARICARKQEYSAAKSRRVP